MGETVQKLGSKTQSISKAGANCSEELGMGQMLGECLPEEHVMQRTLLSPTTYSVTPSLPDIHT